MKERGREIPEEVVAAVYPELRRIARGMMARERKGHTWQPTALVHEAILRVMGLQGEPIRDEQHFFLLVVGQMRRLLVSYARRKQAQKRQGQPVDREWSSVHTERLDEAIEVDSVLDRLQALDKRAYCVVLLRFYGGLSEEETANVMDVTRAMVRRDWEWARVWMYEQLGAPVKD